MEIRTVRLPTRAIVDAASFHAACAAAFGLPDFHGANWDAWIDGMTYLDDAEAGMSAVTVAPGGRVLLEIEDALDLQRRLPDLFQTLLECTAFVNDRRGAPVLALVLGGAL